MTSASTPQELFRWRLRLLSACLLLIGLALTQSPGFLVPDTKLDLALDPVDFLSRASHLWDPEGAFGQLQNQAYGYLWPMGPFFVLGDLVGLPAWGVQRLWLALVLCVAFLGSAKLARELGIRSHLACLCAGFAYALSPRMLTVLGSISIEAWPSSVAPWVLLPLVIGATRGSPWRAAALSALAVALVGGVNAAATAAVLPLGAVWLLTRQPGPRQWRMLVGWPIFTLMATLWWLVPLMVMGAYSPPFLDFIESATNTTFPTTPFDALRGTSDWVAYVDTTSRAGNDLLRQSYLILNSGVLLIAGLAGLTFKRNPHRFFLATGIIVGLLLVTMGHVGATEGWLAAEMQRLLDGLLAPLRNVHKFDLVIRLPMVLGLAWTIQESIERSAGQQSVLPRAQSRAVAGMLIFAVGATALPAASGRITPTGGFSEVPKYWSQAAQWLGQEQEEGVALLVPGSSFGTYTWGRPQDEPMQSLAEKPWAVRNAVPLAPAGNIRMLDAIEKRLVQGRPSPGLADYLRRSGIGHVVVRNDLERKSDIPDPVLVHAAINGSPGLARVARFGPMIGGEPVLRSRSGRRLLVNGGWQAEYPVIEVYKVAGEVPFAVSAEADRPVVVGGPEDLLDLADLGLVDDSPVELASDRGLSRPSGPLILTDGLRAVERNFGRLHDAESATRVRNQPRRLGGRVPDYELPGGARWQTWADMNGVASVDSSSSQADANSFGVVQPGEQPFAAMDRRTETVWRSGQLGDQWWRVQFESTRMIEDIQVTGAGPTRQRIRVSTARGEGEVVDLMPGVTRSIDVGSVSGWLRVEDASGRDDQRLELAEVSIPGIVAERGLVLPKLPPSWPAPDAVVLRAVDDPRTGCVEVDGSTRCALDKRVKGEESGAFKRTFNIPRAAAYQAEIRVRPRPGRALNRLLTTDQPLSARSSSVGNPDVRGSALAALDGSLGTTWTAGPEDQTPQLEVFWLGERAIKGLSMQVDPAVAARRPEVLRVEWPGGQQRVELDESGQGRLKGVRSSYLKITVLESEVVRDLDFDANARSVPVGISELRLEGVPFFPLRLPRSARTTSCQDGPVLEVDGRRISTRVTYRPHSLLIGGSARAELCGSKKLNLGGGHDLKLRTTPAFAPASMILRRSGTQAALGAPVDLLDISPATRLLDSKLGVTSIRENSNEGWSARDETGRLDQFTTDGWRSSWNTSVGGTLEVTFDPDRVYRWGLFGGFISALTLLLLSMVSRRGKRTLEAEELLPMAPSLLVVGGLVSLAGGLLAGWPGLWVSLLGLTTGFIASRRTSTGAWAVALLLLPAVAAYCLRPWGDATGWAGGIAWVGYVVVLSVSAVVGATPSERVVLRLNFKAGRSTPQ